MSENVKIFHLGETENGENLLSVLLKKLQKEGGLFAPCAGGGKCGRCRVRFLEGAPLPTPTERTLLEPEELRSGIRLACLTKPVKDAVLDISPLREQMDRNRDYEIATHCLLELPKTDTEPGDGKENAEKYILAVDLGTTTIAAVLYEKKSGTALAYAADMNPQRSYGADVVSRMQAALQSPQAAKDMQTCVQEQIGKLMDQLLTKVGQRESVKTVLAANTTMIHLFLGLSVEGLSRAPFTPVTLTPEPIEFHGLPMEFVPGISAFVGGDIVAGMLACRMLEKGTSDTLFLDLGTNAEMVYLDDCGKLVATAAAAGSAFEGKSEKCLYGSESVHELADLLRKEKIDRTGTYIKEDGAYTLSQQEIRNLQLAKAAVRTGMDMLTERKIPERIFLAGGFGRKLSIPDAVTIGLFPAEVQQRIRAVGNTALPGAYLYGCMQKPVRLKEKLARVEARNLAEQPEFQTLFLKYCNL